MIKNSKKSIILFELLISISIISIVIIFSLLFINNLYKNNSQNMKILNHKLDLKSTILFIQNRLQTQRSPLT